MSVQPESPESTSGYEVEHHRRLLNRANELFDDFLHQVALRVVAPFGVLLVLTALIKPLGSSAAAYVVAATLAGVTALVIGVMACYTYYKQADVAVKAETPLGGLLALVALAPLGITVLFVILGLTA
jgi:hypothetical protein